MKAHKSDVKEIEEENRKMNFRGPLVLVWKVSREEVGSNGETEKNKEGFLRNSNGEAIAYWKDVLIYVLINL